MPCVGEFASYDLSQIESSLYVMRFKEVHADKVRSLTSQKCTDFFLLTKSQNKNSEKISLPNKPAIMFRTQ